MAGFTHTHQTVRKGHATLIHVLVESPEVKAVTRQLKRELDRLAKKYKAKINAAKIKAAKRKAK